MSFDVLPTTRSLTVVTRPPSRPTDAVIWPAQWRRRVTHHGSRGPRQRGMLVLLLQWRHRSITITTAGLPHTCSCFIIANDVTWQTQATSHGHTGYDTIEVFNVCRQLHSPQTVGLQPLDDHGYSCKAKASRARPGQAVICNFWHPGTLTLSHEILEAARHWRDRHGKGMKSRVLIEIRKLVWRRGPTNWRLPPNVSGTAGYFSRIL